MGRRAGELSLEKREAGAMTEGELLEIMEWVWWKEGKVEEVRCAQCGVWRKVTHGGLRGNAGEGNNEAERKPSES